MPIINTFRQSFSPLLIPNFRLYLGGLAISLVGTWLQMTALGIVGMLSTLPLLLLGPWAGVWADRLDRRRLLIASQIGAMLLAFILAALTQTGFVQLWHVYGLALLLGIITAIEFPAQQAFLGDLSGMAEVRKAVNLFVMILQMSRVLGPALAGFIIGQLGAALAFWLNGLSFIAVIVSLFIVRAQQARSTKTDHAAGGFGEALDFIRRQPRIQDLLLLVILITFFGFAIFNIIPAVAGGVPEITGLLLAASGLGALISVILIVPLTQAARRTGLVVAGAVLWSGVWLLPLSFSWLPLQVMSIFFFSLSGPIVMTMALGLMHVLAPPTMRARLLSIFTMVSFGLQPFASLLIGYNADLFGATQALRINGVALLIGAALMLALRAGLRQWETVAASPVRVAESSA